MATSKMNKTNGEIENSSKTKQFDTNQHATHKSTHLAHDPVAAVLTPATGNTFGFVLADIVPKIAHAA